MARTNFVCVFQGAATVPKAQGGAFMLLRNSAVLVLWNVCVMFLSDLAIEKVIRDSPCTIPAASSTHVRTICVAFCAASGC